MKLISWNVNGIRACNQKGLGLFVKKEKPDILCLQETKAHPEDLDDDLKNLMKKSSHWSFADKKGYSGTATFLKKPVIHVHHGIGLKKFDYEGRFIVTDHENFLLFNVYFPNGSQREERHLFKQDFLKRFLAYLKRTIKKGREIIVAGDYNTAYLNEDVFDSVQLKNTSGFLAEERQWFREFLSAGFIDCYRHFYPDKKNVYTWWSYRENARKNNRGWRIDHICITKGLIKKLKAVDILFKQQGSDHCPVMIQI